MKQAVIIGSGFAGLSAACHLARVGHSVTVLEKNETPGGRARSFAAQGFTFDMGPSWYWMPDVFERFFGHFGKGPSDYYDLQRLDPSYQVVWEDETVAIPANYDELRALFERIEPGAAVKLDAFLKEAEYKYKKSMDSLVYKPGLSIQEFMRWDVAGSLFKIDLLTSMHRHVRKYFSNPKLQQLAEFPILFLGALPKNTPALYSLMNYADMKLGTWYPMGGMANVTWGMYELAESLGVQFKFDEAVAGFTIYEDEVASVITKQNRYDADVVIAACDYHHAEQLLPANYRNYKDSYWESRDMAPSCLLYYIGTNKKIDNLQHHNLFFDAQFDVHAAALYTDPQWPEKPLMYVCCPSKTDKSVAPKGCENLFILIPVAPGLKDNEEIRARYFNIAIERVELRTGVAMRDSIIYQRCYAHNEFVADYNAYKGNAYGLANTLRQTALLKPSIRNKKLHNLFYAGQLTVPGPGVPPAIISGEIAARQAHAVTTKTAIP